MDVMGLGRPRLKTWVAVITQSVVGPACSCFFLVEPPTSERSRDADARTRLNQEKLAQNPPHKKEW